MRLTELQGYRQYRDMTLRQIADLLQKHGHKVASGAFAVTLVPKNAEYVYRVYTRDDGYEAWLRVLKKNQGEHFVKIFKHRKLPIMFKRSKEFKSEYMHIVKLEKLTPIPFTSMIGRTIGAVNEMLKNTGVTDVPGMLENLGDWFDGSDDAGLEEARNIIRKRESFFKVYAKIHHAASGSLMPDLHSDNVMMRKNGALVITDPFVSVHGDTWSLSDLLKNEVERMLDQDSTSERARSK